ncbi:hypothetical protein DA798_09635 [Lactobacillus sp. PFC-70]|nr:hypothetical protein DA798_09635 [Lactobacillus sp. PFC-70]
MQVFLDEVGNASLGIALAKKPSIPTAKRVVATTTVPGSRHGSLTQKQGWEDVILTCTFTVVPELIPGLTGTQGFNDVLRRLNAWAMNAERLKFSDDHNFYRLVKQVEIDEATPEEVELVGTVKVAFTLDPFWYQESDTVVLTAGTTIYNPGSASSDPLITVYGSGDLDLTINGTTVTLLNVTDYLTIDSWEQTILHGNGTEMLDEKFRGVYPQLLPGDNAISFSSNVKKVEIDGRWAWL